MSARRNIAQRTTPPNQQTNNVRSAMAGPRFTAEGQQQEDVKKMHPMNLLSLHEDRLNEIDTKMSQIQNQLTQNQTKRTGGDDSALIAECIKQIKFLTQENQTNRNLARELTLELLRLKTSLQEDGKIEMRISEESQEKYATFKEKASQNVRDELTDGGENIVVFSGNGAYDPNAL